MVHSWVACWTFFFLFTSHLLFFKKKKEKEKEGIGKGCVLSLKREIFCFNTTSTLPRMSHKTRTKVASN